MFHLLSIGSLRSLQVRRLGILVVVAFGFFVAPAWSQTCSNTVIGAFTCVRNATNNNASNSTSVTYAGGYTAGQLIVVGVIGNIAAAWTAGNVTNTNAYTWTLWGDVLSSPSPQHMAIYYAKVPSTTAGSDTITATNSNGPTTLTILDSAIYSGVGLIDGAGISNTGNSTTPSSGAYAVTGSDLAIGFGVAGGGTIAAGSGWNNRENDTGIGGGPYSMLEDQSAAGNSATATFTALTGNWGVIGISFRPPLAANTGGQFISSPMFPQVVPSATYPPDTGYTIPATLASGGNLQTAINAMTCGTKQNLAHNGTFSGGILNLPNNSCTCHTDPTKWQIIQGDQFEANYVAGVRTDPSTQYLQYPHISSNDTNYTFYALAAANCWGFAGLDVTETANNANSVFSLGDATFTQANFPKDFALWGNYIHGQPTLNLTRCITFNGTGAAIVDNYISDCHKVGQDSQCYGEWDGFGQVLFQDNFCEGATENFLLGGAIPFTVGTVKADFTYQKNHNFKPLSWRLGDATYAGIHWSVKNIFEVKGVQRLNVNSNVFDNSWGDGQVGNLVTINTGPYAVNDAAGLINDINFFYNIIRHGAEAYQLGNNTPTPIYRSNNRFLFHDNLDYDIVASKWANVFGGGFSPISISGAQLGAIFGPFDIWFNHETIETMNGGQSGLYFAGNYPGVDNANGMQFRNSIIGGPNQNFTLCQGNNGGDVLLTLPCAPGGTFTNDCMYGRPGGDGFTYANAAFANRQTPNTEALVFVNPGALDFHVLASSACHLAASDGLDMGANIDAVNAATAGVVHTLGNAVNVTNVSPATFTAAGGTSITITGTNFLAESALGVIVGGAGPTSAISTTTCAVNTCTVVMSAAISLQVNDTVNVQQMVGTAPGLGGVDQGQFIVASFTDTTHWTYTDTGVGTRSWTGGTANRVTPGNACTSVSVVSTTSITCTTPAASGAVTTGPVSVFVSQWGVPVQSTVFGNYN